MRHIAAVLIAICVSCNAHAVNKCIGADGKAVYQDAPCAGRGGAIDIRPASGWAPPAKPSADGIAPSGAMTAAQRMEQKADDSKRERRRRELETRIVPNAQQAISRHQESCNRDMAGLRAKKGLASNNLAGAQWETAISGEMAAVAARCDTGNRELRAELDANRAECRAMGGCQ